MFIDRHGIYLIFTQLEFDFVQERLIAVMRIGIDPFPIGINRGVGETSFARSANGGESLPVRRVRSAQLRKYYKWDFDIAWDIIEDGSWRFLDIVTTLISKSSPLNPSVFGHFKFSSILHGKTNQIFERCRIYGKPINTSNGFKYLFLTMNPLGKGLECNVELLVNRTTNYEYAQFKNWVISNSEPAEYERWKGVAAHVNLSRHQSLTLGFQANYGYAIFLEEEYTKRPGFLYFVSESRKNNQNDMICLFSSPYGDVKYLIEYERLDATHGQ